MILDQFPHVLWINLDISTDRRTYMEKLLDAHHISHTRIPAISGLDRTKPDFMTCCIKNPKMSLPENACTCSHLKAIRHFLDQMTAEFVVIFEDDVNFDFLHLIPYNWSDFMTHLPAGWQVIQLAVSTERNLDVKPWLVRITPKSYHYSSGAYLINRSGAAELMGKYLLDDKFNLNQTHATADAMIANTNHTYSIPIFSYLTETSTIHPMHLVGHVESKEKQQKAWAAWTQQLLEPYFARFKNPDVIAH